MKLNPVAFACIGATALTMHSMVNARLLRRPIHTRTADHASGGGHSPGIKPSVSILIPARNEALRIGPTITAALAQGHPDFEVLVLDDGSTDDTRGVAHSVAGEDPRFRLLTGAPLAEGWLGKPHACWQLAEAASGEVLVFVDADVTLAPEAVAASLEILDRAGLDMVSPYPRQITGSIAERVVQPLLQWSWMTFLPLRLAEILPAESLTAGNGQLLVVRRQAYDAAGGHTAVRNQVIEDVELARAVKRAGGRVGMADGSQIATCRMYEGWSELREGYSKSLWKAFGSRGGAMFTMCLLAALYVLPPVAGIAGLLSRRRSVAMWGTGGYLAGVVGRMVTARATGGRPDDAWTHPFAILTLAHLTHRSWRLRRVGGLTWKGRAV